MGPAFEANAFPNQLLLPRFAVEQRTMISKEAELFEKANVIDVGPQHNEAERQRRSLDGSFDHLDLHDKPTRSPNRPAPPIRPSNGDACAGDDDDDSITGLNIDEVDMPIPHVTGNAVNGSIDPAMDNNLIVDEAFQRSLDERASQFASSEGNSINTNSFPEVPKPKVPYDYTDKVNFRRELDEWFTSREMMELAQYRLTFQSHLDCPDYNRLSVDSKENVMEQLIYELNTENHSDALGSILYVMLGAYEEDQFIFEDQFIAIQRNTMFTTRSNVLSALLNLFESSFAACATAKTGLVSSSKTFFQTCTALYITALVFTSDGIEESESETLRCLFDDHQVLMKLIAFINQWRWNSRASMRIRNVITLFAVMLKFQVGGLGERKKLKKELCSRLDIKTGGPDHDLPSASPIDFHLFRQEISSRYPAYIPPPSTLPSDFDDSSSLLQFITVPRQHAPPSRGMSAQPPPTIHISTPAPSPTGPLGSLSKPMKGKRSFQTDVSYPLMYPTDAVTDEVPASIREASELFASRIKDKLSLRQMWTERDLFVKQERGWNDTSDVSNGAFDYSKNGCRDLASLNRVEALYSQSLGNLSSLVHVLLQLVVSSHSNIDLILNKKHSTAELEMLRAKEILFKNATYTLVLLLRWFKTNHILKFEYLSTLIYDANFISIVMQYLRVLDVKVLDRIENTVLFDYQSSIWADREERKSVDENFCFTLVNLLEITALICGKKTQRIMTMSETDPAGPFRNLLSIYNTSIWSPILKIVKSITPFSGKKWKAINMDLISMVYLHSKCTLRDNWLSGKDVEGEIADAYGQEIALRALIQFYNMRNYAESMEMLGYEKKNRDFFVREVELADPDF